MRSLFQALACCLAATCCCSAYGQLLATVSLEITDQPDGRLQYNYLIQNLTGSELTINTFVLDVGTGANLEELEGPPGWFGDYDPFEDPFELAFVALNPESEIPVGGSGNFSFTSPLQPGPVLYYLANLAGDGSELGAILEFVEGPALGLAGIPGDYNGNGAVEQADLDLVLLNWGNSAAPPPGNWINDLPSGLIDQDELDGVLLNWGNTASQVAAGAPVPEPTAAGLAIAALALIAVWCVQWRNGPRNSVSAKLD